LLGVLLVGAVLRLVAVVSWWPTSTMLSDGYQLYASDPFANPLHPAGYSLILGALGSVTREVAPPVLLQHLSGIVSAFLLFAATRRVTGSEWAGLLPAGIVLLDPDFIYLEHAIMSESWIVLGISAGLYAAVRAFDDPEPWWRWPLLAGFALGLAVTIRAAPLLTIPVAALALFLCAARSVGRRPYWRAAAAVVGSSAVILLTFATANATFGERFGLGASPGWYLYARAAEFADCSSFTPPAGTMVLCEDRPAGERPGTRFYAIDPNSPANRFFGPFGDHDGLLGTWARRAILAQPGDYLWNVWDYARAYWFPDSRHSRPDSGGDLDPQLSFTNVLADSGDYDPAQVRSIEQLQVGGLEAYYNDFNSHEYRPGLEFLRGWQHITRFGATALSITTALTLLGLAIGTRRSRVSVLLFGVGGLSLIVAPAMTANYYGRYTVPMAGPLMAAAAITMVALLRWFRDARTSEIRGQ
jgi:Dolichyl-phosphate-mannose-protein mannosyltransferase